jgi:hypothetical protein
MLEITFFAAAKCSKEARRITHSLRICFIVSFPFKLTIIQFLEQCSVVLVLDIMLEAAFVTIASAREIAILDGGRHPFQYVIILVK